MKLFKRRPLLPPEVQEVIVNAVREAEAGTTGEVRVFVEPHCSYMDAMDRAQELFYSLGMEKTEHRNAILVYLATRDKQFAILGDEEIYFKAGGPVFWEAAGIILRQHLKEGKMAEGLAACVRELGTALTNHFPHDASINKNELPDNIVFGK